MSMIDDYHDKTQACHTGWRALNTHIQQEQHVSATTTTLPIFIEIPIFLFLPQVFYLSAPILIAMSQKPSVITIATKTGSWAAIQLSPRYSTLWTKRYLLIIARCRAFAAGIVSDLSLHALSPQYLCSTAKALCPATHSPSQSSRCISPHVWLWTYQRNDALLVDPP